MNFADFLDRVEGNDRTLAVVNRDAPDAVVGMLEDAFADQSVGIEERELAEYDEDTVLLLEDGDVVETSPLSALTDTILVANSDLYTTGTVGLEEFEMPAVLAELTGERFSLRGYPESNTEKLLLILVSRHIERLAWQCGDGRLRSSFQRLSRIEDEIGTRAVYERVARTDAVVHTYGIPDWTPPAELDVRMHGSHDDDLRRTWFVLFRPPTGGTTSDGTAPSDGPADGDHPDPAALLAIETEPRTWDGFWTRDPDLVGDIERYIQTWY